MAIVDLSLIFGEPLEFKNVYGEDYTIPHDIPTQFTLKMHYYTGEVRKLKNNEEKAVEMMQQMVTDILNLDSTKQVELHFVKSKFSIKAMQIIISETMKHIRNIESDPNSNIPESLKEEQ